MNQCLLDFCHGIDENREEVLLENDYPNPAALYLVASVVLVIDALLASDVLLQVGSVVLTMRLDGHPEPIVGDDSRVVAFVVVEATAEVIEVFEHLLNSLLGHPGHKEHLTAVFVLDIDVLLLHLASLDLGIAQKWHMLDHPQQLFLGEVPDGLEPSEDVEFDVEIAGHVGDELELAEDVVDAEALLEGGNQGMLG